MGEVFVLVGLFARAEQQHLFGARAVAEDRDAFAAEAVRQPVEAGHFGGGGGGGEVDGFRYGVVDMGLKSGLHADVELGWDFEGGGEEGSEIRREAERIRQAAFVQDGVEDGLRGEAALLERAEEDGVQDDQGFIGEYVRAAVGEGE